MLEKCSCHVIVLGRKTFIIYVKTKQDDHDDRVDTIWEIVEGHSITIFNRVKRFLFSSSNYERCLDARFIIRHFGMICFVNNMFPSFMGQIDRIPVPVFNNPSFSGLPHFKLFRHFEGFSDLLSLDLSL